MKGRLGLPLKCTCIARNAGGFRRYIGGCSRERIRPASGRRCARHDLTRLILEGLLSAETNCEEGPRAHGIRIDSCACCCCGYIDFVCPEPRGRKHLEQRQEQPDQRPLMRAGRVLDACPRPEAERPSRADARVRQGFGKPEGGAPRLQWAQIERSDPERKEVRICSRAYAKRARDSLNTR